MPRQRVLWLKCLGTAADPLQDAWWERANGGGCDATGATSLLALAALGLLRRRR